MREGRVQEHVPVQAELMVDVGHGQEGPDGTHEHAGEERVAQPDAGVGHDEVQGRESEPGDGVLGGHEAESEEAGPLRDCGALQGHGHADQCGHNERQQQQDHHVVAKHAVPGTASPDAPDPVERVLDVHHQAEDRRHEEDPPGRPERRGIGAAARERHDHADRVLRRRPGMAALDVFETLKQKADQGLLDLDFLVLARTRLRVLRRIHAPAAFRFFQRCHVGPGRRLHVERARGCGRVGLPLPDYGAEQVVDGFRHVEGLDNEEHEGEERHDGEHGGEGQGRGAQKHVVAEQALHEQDRHADVLDDEPVRDRVARHADPPHVVRDESPAPVQGVPKLLQQLAHRAMLQSLCEWRKRGSRVRSPSRTAIDNSRDATGTIASSSPSSPSSSSSSSSSSGSSLAAPWLVVGRLWLVIVRSH